MKPSIFNAWRCQVCGYIHRGIKLPEWCPVCGASQDMFEPYEDEIKRETVSEVTGWKCLNCSYIHTSKNLPDKCPVCGVRSDRFEPTSEIVKATDVSQGPSKVIIAGAGIAGVSAAAAVHEVSGNTEIILISKESEIPYYRLNLTRFLAGEIDEKDLYIHPESWYKERNILLVRDCEVSGISLKDQIIETSNGRKESFDKLILTIGSHPFIPPIPGVMKKGVTTLRTIDNARTLLEKVKPGIKVICIGGGILGIETAGALAHRGAIVTLLEGYAYTMPNQLNRTAGSIFADYLAESGIKLMTSVRIDEILGDERAYSVKLNNNMVLPSDLVVITAGVRPNSYLARNAGLEVNSGIIVDNFLTTSHPNIYAAGDIAEHRGVVYGTWSPSQYQGSIAGRNTAGNAVEFGGVPRSNILKILGVNLFSIGQINPGDASYEVFEKVEDGKYFGFIFQGTYLVGAILLGDTSLTAYIKNAVESAQDFSGLLEKRPGIDDILNHFAEKAPEIS